MFGQVNDNYTNFFPTVERSNPQGSSTMCAAAYYSTCMATNVEGLRRLNHRTNSIQASVLQRPLGGRMVNGVDQLK